MNCREKCKAPILCNECLMKRVLSELMKDKEFRKKSGAAKLEYALFILNLSIMKRDRVLAPAALEREIKTTRTGKETK